MKYEEPVYQYALRLVEYEIKGLRKIFKQNNIKECNIKNNDHAYNQWKYLANNPPDPKGFLHDFEPNQQSMKDIKTPQRQLHKFNIVEEERKENQWREHNDNKSLVIQF